MPWSPAPSSFLPVASTPWAMWADWRVQVAGELGLLPVEALLLVADVLDRRRGPCPPGLDVDRPCSRPSAPARTSPASTMRLVVTRVSQATRASGSAPRKASTTVSEMRSPTLSGWPSDTLSLVNTKSPLRTTITLQGDMMTGNRAGLERRRLWQALTGPSMPLGPNCAKVWRGIEQSIARQAA